MVASNTEGLSNDRYNAVQIRSLSPCTVEDEITEQNSGLE